MTDRPPDIVDAKDKRGTSRLPRPLRSLCCGDAPDAHHLLTVSSVPNEANASTIGHTDEED